MSLIDCCCGDVLQDCVLNLLDPSHVCQLVTCCKELLQLAHLRRTAILLARHKLRVYLRRRRLVLQQQALFVKQQCKLEELEERMSLQDKILQQLQASPDGIRDLAAAVQHSLAAVAHQTAVPPAHLRHVKQDLMRMAHFVCLLVWRLQLRSRRARRLQQQPDNGDGQGNLFADAGFNDEDAVVVVLNNENVPHNLAPEEVQQVELEGVQHDNENIQGLLDYQQDQLLEVTVHIEQQQHALVPPLQQPQQQHLAAMLAPAPAPEQASVSIAVQTDDLGPTMREVQDLLSGLTALMQPGNPSLKPGRATLALLNYQITQQLQAWNPQQNQPQVLQPLQ